MGKLLLGHIQKAACVPVHSDEDLPITIKNTFLNIKNINPDSLPRFRTAPSPVVAGESKYELYHEEAEDGSAWAQDGLLDESNVEDLGYGLPQTSVEEEIVKGTALNSVCTKADPTTGPAGFDLEKSPALDKPVETKPRDDNELNKSPAVEETKLQDANAIDKLPEVDETVRAKPKDDNEYRSRTPEPKTLSNDPMTDQAMSAWIVDGKKLTRSRDTRASTVLRPLIGDGPDCMEMVVSIFPVPKNAKRGGANFKAAEGICRIQLKCNNPVDKELSISITVGPGKARSFKKHNFMANPLMTFDGDWDFKTLIDPNVDRSVVTLTLRLRLAEDETDAGSDAHLGGDQAIRAFSVSGKVSSEPTQIKQQSTGLHLSSPPTLPQQQTPEQTPRSLSQGSWATPVCGPSPTVAAPSSPYFTCGNSVLFNFTLRRADGVELGLDVARNESDQELLVQKVVPGGAVESWNRQCFAGPYASKALVPSDRIVGVNGRVECASMLEECRCQQLIKIFVVRGDLPHSEIPYGWCGTPPIAAPIQLVHVPVVPVCFPIASFACVKHAIVVGEYDAGAIGAPDQLAADPVPPAHEAAGTSNLRATAPEFCPTPLEQDDMLDICSDDEWR
jgi:hypothetical protein